MFHLGEYNDLKAIKKTEHGLYLAEVSHESNPSMSDSSGKYHSNKENSNKSNFDRGIFEEKVLLPNKQAQGINVGDEVRVFLYKDSSDRLIATKQTPKITLNCVALLKVSSVGKIGAFVDWGLDKDLLLPFREQTKKVSKDEEVLVALYIDKTGRLALTMNVYEYLSQESPYKVGEVVSGRVYLISERFGAFVAVDDKYSALIPRKELFSDVKIGKIIEARVTEVKSDGKLNLSIRKKAYEQMDDDAEAVMKVIEEFDGVLPFNDKADPDVIKREFNMSKNEFKRAVGRLYKQRRIEITDRSIRKL